jgi:excisionase family DNA binding protein
VKDEVIGLLPWAGVKIEDLPPCLTIKETAALLRRGINQTRRDLTSGRLPCVRWGRTIRVLRDDLIAALRREQNAGEGSER